VVNPAYETDINR